MLKKYPKTIYKFLASSFIFLLMAISSAYAGRSAEGEFSYFTNCVLIFIIGLIFSCVVCTFDIMGDEVLERSSDSRNGLIKVKTLFNSIFVICLAVAGFICMKLFYVTGGQKIDSISNTTYCIVTGIILGITILASFVYYKFKGSRSN